MAVWQFLRASFYHGAKIRNSAVLPLAGNLLGSAFPKPCFAASAAYPRRAHAARKEVKTMRKKYNTPPPQPRCENPAVRR